MSNPIARRGLEWLLGTRGPAPDTFLASYIGEQMLHVAPDGDRFDALFSWDDLNRVLNSELVSHPQARLLREGRPLEPATYTRDIGGRKWIDSALCQRQMAEGATLIVMGVDRVNPRLERLVRLLEHDLHANAEVSIVATCGMVPGLPVHWDVFECFNVQIAGEKEWQVYRPTRSHPLSPTRRFPGRTDLVSNHPPDEPPAWSGILKPGEMLYLPRGWWHAVRPHTVPSLHVSIAVDIPTFSDFITWQIGQSKAHDQIRHIIPCWATRDERQRLVAQALATVTATLCPDAIDEYLSQVDESVNVRSDFSLPGGGSPDGIQLGPATLLRLRSPHAVRWVTTDGMVRLTASSREYQFSDRVVPALQRLSRPDPLTLRELGEGVDPIVVRAFLMTLVTAGIVSVVAEATPSPATV